MFDQIKSFLQKSDLGLDKADGIFSLTPCPAAY